MVQKVGTYGKTHGKTANSYGGGVTVWDNNSELLRRYPYGAVFTDTLADGDIVPSGTPVAFDRDAKTVTICKAFKVYEAVTGSYTEVKILKGAEDDLWRVAASDNLMVAPATQTGTGTGVAVSAVDTAGDYYDTITVASGAFGDLAKGDVLVYAEGTGADQAQSVIATDLIEDNIYVGTGDTNAVAGTPINCAVVWAGSVMKKRMPPYPAYLERADVAGQRYVFNPE